VTSWLERIGRDGVPPDSAHAASPPVAASPVAASPAGTARQRERRFTELYREHYPYVLRFALRRLRTLDAAQDATVATFAVVWSRFDEVPSMPRAWIYRVARSVVSLELRQRMRDERVPDGAGSSRLRLAEQDLEDDPVLRALSELQDDDREVLQLRAWEELSGEEIGEVLGCSPNDAAARLHDAQQRLKELLGGAARHDASAAPHQPASGRRARVRRTPAVPPPQAVPEGQTTPAARAVPNASRDASVTRRVRP
jgi:RNA polymerase sigma-70 factor (ECF subfamily)